MSVAYQIRIVKINIHLQFETKTQFLHPRYYHYE